VISAQAFHRAVAMACASRGITLRALCDRSRVDPSTLNPGRAQRRMENGTLGLPSLDTIGRLEKGLGLPSLGLLLLAQSIDLDQAREAA
jgi:transcriptional regulator with XRE-family HTH domain